MPVYKKRVDTRNPRFKGRATHIITAETHDIIPVDDSIVLCNSCNANIYDPDRETFGWLIYFDKRDVKADRPYDFYCDQCTTRSFPKATEIS